eukprot:7693634-Pyramimonas_sp.AAC.1
MATEAGGKGGGGGGTGGGEGGAGGEQEDEDQHVVRDGVRSTLRPLVLLLGRGQLLTGKIFRQSDWGQLYLEGVERMLL